MIGTITVNAASGSITNNGSTASTDSPFDDPEGFKFGEGDENIIKTGSYVGNGSSSAPPEVYLGWEPQWVMVKRTNQSGGDWVIVDSMRGMYGGLSQMPHLRANVNNSEANTSYYRIDVSSGSGFAPFTTDNGLNGNGDTYVYIACRRSDGYVGKPADAGTDVFAMDRGSGSSTIPTYDSGFPVDFAFARRFANTDPWYTSARLIQGKFLEAHASTAAQASDNYIFDSNTGWAKSHDSQYQSWMFKRGAGVDVVTYQGNGGTSGGRRIRHSLNQKPQMIFIKHRSSGSYNWTVYHEGLNSGTNPQEKHLYLNTTDAQQGGNNVWNNMQPTSNDFVIGSNDMVNNANQPFIAVLFSSVDKISKVGYYTGDGSNESVTTGFQPRFIIIRRVDYAEDWFVFDSLRGLASGSADPYLRINTTAAQSTSASFFDISSTGFTVTGNFYNNNVPYIYYAHA